MESDRELGMEVGKKSRQKDRQKLKNNATRHAPPSHAIAFYDQADQFSPLMPAGHHLDEFGRSPPPSMGCRTLDPRRQRVQPCHGVWV
jgi:hypothetical protein